MFRDSGEECCRRCKSSRAMIDHAAKKRTCFDCGLDLSYYSIDEDVTDMVHSPEDTTEPHKGSCDDLLSFTLGNSHTRGSADPLVSENTSSDDDDADKDNLQNRGSRTDLIDTMSNRLGLLEAVKNQAVEMFNQIKDEIKVRKNVVFAACILLASRNSDKPLTIDEIYKVTDVAKKGKIISVAESISRKLGLGHLMNPRAVDYIKRFSSTLGMDSQANKAGQEAAEKYTEIATKSRSPLSVAAAVMYVMARVSLEKKLLKDIAEATGVHEVTINEAYKDMYPHLSEITPEWFAKASDLTKLGSS